MHRGLFAKTIAALGVLLLALSSAQAATVSYTATLLSGNKWRYDYTLDNTVPAPTFDGFTVYFDPALFEHLTGAQVPLGWDPLVLQTDTVVPADGAFDALLKSGPLADGAVVTGFSVSFTYLGSDNPGSQRIELYDSGVLSGDFAVVQTGRTSSAQQVDEPASAALALLAMGLAPIWRRPRRAAATAITAITVEEWT